MADGSGFKVIEPADDDKGKREPPQRERIIEAVLDAGVSFWIDQDHDAYATVPAGDHHERHRVRSRHFKLLVRSFYGQANPVTNKDGSTRPSSASDSAMAEAIPAFEAMALATRDMREVAVRVTRDDQAVWLDLGDQHWTLIRIAPEGWRVSEAAKVPLIRPNGMRALPMPSRDPDALATLRHLLNVAPGTAGDHDFRLIVGWLIAALNPTGPYAVLALDGEQGSGKSTVAKMLRTLIDANLAAHRAPPRNEDDLLIAAMNGRVVALDNVSFIEPEMADALCRLATGAGFSKRRLYSDAEEHVIAVARPVLLNGIPSLLARGDLADRALAITLPAIPDGRRRPESEVWQAFNAAAPSILGLLLDGLATALRNLPTLHLARLPRMADFARLACAGAPAFGWTAGDMLAALEANREAAAAAVIDADTLAAAIGGFMAQRHRWDGTASELLTELNGLAPVEAQRERGWPKDGARLSTRLRRLAPALRRTGVIVSLPQSGGRGGRQITIAKTQDMAGERSERSEGSGPDQPPAGSERWNAGNADLPYDGNPDSAGAEQAAKWSAEI